MATISEQVNALSNIVESAKADSAKAETGNKAAGTRVRKAMQELKTAAQAVRVAVSANKNTEK